MFYLSEGNPYGDPIADITPYKDGYLLKTFGVEDACVTFDQITAEDGEELIKFMDTPEKAFDECGAEEVFNGHVYIRIKSYYGYEEIIDGILEDDAVCKFMENACAQKGYRDQILSHIWNTLNAAGFDLDQIEKEFNFDDMKYTMKEICTQFKKYMENSNE